MNRTNDSRSAGPAPSAASSASPCLTYEEARQMHLDDFARWTPDEKMEWLADMLELMEMAEEARKLSAPP
jgi:hypothetical protein